MLIENAARKGRILLRLFSNNIHPVEHHGMNTSPHRSPGPGLA